MAWALAVALISSADLSAADDPGVDFFESRIRPILVENCYDCHSVEKGKSKGGLRVDDREALRRGGDSGPAVVEGKPGESLLLSAMRHDDPDLEMPPRKPRLADGTIFTHRYCGV